VIFSPVDKEGWSSKGGVCTKRCVVWQSCLQKRLTIVRPIPNRRAVSLFETPFFTDSTIFSLRSSEYTLMLLAYSAHHHRNLLSDQMRLLQTFAWPAPITGPYNGSCSKSDSAVVRILRSMPTGSSEA
jgi:hypothetical protein